MNTENLSNENETPILRIGAVMPRFSSVLSLFDGMSCGQIALNKVGIEYDNYFASEIDKHAIKITQKNYPNTIQLGTIENWKQWDIDWSKIDLLIGGSPCQGFSSSGKGLNFDDPRSKLFFVFSDILNHIKTQNSNVKFLLENVKMKKEWENVISEYLSINPIEIDSKIFTPMRRKRLYWCNWDIELPNKKNEILTSILDENVDDSYFIKKEQLEKLVIYKNGRTYIKNLLNKELEVFHGDGVILSRTWQTYMPIIKNQCHCIRSANPNDSGVAVIKNGVINFRKFTLSEMEKLQSLPIGYTKYNSLSEKQSKMLIGNGWTVDVIAHIFGSLLNRA